MLSKSFPAIDRLFNSLNIEIISHGQFTGDENWNYPDVHSPFSRLYFITGGAGRLKTPKHEVPLLPGHMVLIPLNTTNSYSCEHRIEKFYIHFRADLYYGYDIFAMLEDCIDLPYDPSILAPVLESLEQNEISGLLALKSLLYGCIQRFYGAIPDRSGGAGTRTDGLYKYLDVFRFVKENCSFSLSSRDVVQAVHAPGLAADFRRDTGQTLKEYIRGMLLQHAREKILTTDMSIKAIAYSLDFRDEFYFSRFFKKYTGVSPRDYRRSKMG
jgi:AraC-like DNA-binding protein